jgi:hypothetical protein
VVLSAFSTQSQNVLIDFNFTSSTLPDGVTSSGTVSTGGSIGSCTVCSAGRLPLALSGYLQVDVPSVSFFKITAKSAGSSARTLTVKYKIDGTDDYTTAGTISAPQVGGEFLLTTTFPELITTSEGERKAAITEGFRLIAAYIFGANKPSAKISMTAPVQQQAKQTIAMTAPVTQKASDGDWTVSFIMPKGWSMDTLPAPTNKRVKLVPVPAKRMVVIRFSGTADDRSIATKTAELRKYAADHTLSVIGEPALAFYNPPWTLPFLRRNEIILGLAAA